MRGGFRFAKPPNSLALLPPPAHIRRTRFLPREVSFSPRLRASSPPPKADPVCRTPNGIASPLPGKVENRPGTDLADVAVTASPLNVPSFDRRALVLQSPMSVFFSMLLPCPDIMLSFPTPHLLICLICPPDGNAIRLLHASQLHH